MQCGKRMITNGEVKELKEFDRLTGKEVVRSKYMYYKCPDYDCGYSDRAWHTHDMISYDIERKEIRDVGYGNK